VLENAGVTENQNPVLDTGLDKSAQEDHDLRQVINAWPELPENIRAAIKELVRKQG
jgi:hypothetical protein